MQQLGINGLSFTIVSDIIIVKDATEAPLLQAAFYNFFKDKNVWRVPDTWYMLVRSPWPMELLWVSHNGLWYF